jgi:anaerobic magnesium-protoporphyrin IX monomethyl ester cyclase
MKRIVFLIPGTIFGTPSTPHVGVSYLAAYVRALGYEPYVLDMRVERFSMSRLKGKIKEIDPHYVAITSTSLQYKDVYKLINTLSDWGLSVIYGGSHVSIVREKVFDECDPFVAIYGEGEETLAAILSGVEVEKTPGVIYRNSSGDVIVNPPHKAIADLDRLPFPAYELSKMHLYAEKKIPLITSRGCPCRCTYCSAHSVMERGFRARSPENVVAEIEKWYKKGYRLFGINDDTFTSDLTRVEKICDLIREKKLEIAWELRTGVRVDRVNESLLEKMKSAGCIFLAFGIESIDDSVLAKARKGITSAQIRTAVAAAERVGIPFSGFFMIGLPGDTFEKFLTLYQFALTHKFDEVRFYNLEPYPSTEVFDWVQQHGRMFETPEEFLNSSSTLKNLPRFETDDFTLQERNKATDLGEYLVVRKLLIKTLGVTLGGFASLFARQKHLRGLMFSTGFRFASVIRKIHVQRAIS